jgi:hypothetical protein
MAKAALERKLAECVQKFKIGGDIDVVLNFASITMLPRPKNGYHTSTDLHDVTKFLDPKDGIPVIFTNVVNSKQLAVAGVGIPAGLVLGNNAEDDTIAHEMGHVAGVRYPVPGDNRLPNSDGSPPAYDPKYDPTHNPDPDYLMYYTDNGGKVDCQYCSKLAALAK